MVNNKLVDIICEPITGADLQLNWNILKNPQGKEYEIVDGIPVLVDILDKKKNAYALNLFKEKAETYDDYQHLSFETFYLDENQVRNSLIDKLNIDNQSRRILALNAGTGRDSEFGRILLNYNRHYGNVFDVSAMPIEARNASLSWILNGAGFCVEFEVGEGELKADFDIPGIRDGTLKTCY